VPAPPADRFSEAGMLAEADLFLSSPAFRRKAVEDSLANPKNTYSKHRLDNYALQTRGWDLLPVWNPRSVPVDKELAAKVKAGEPITIDPATPPLWNEKKPTTLVEWVALGREVFFGYPLRVEPILDFALKNPDIGEKTGVHATSEGLYPGIRGFIDVDGKSAIGITCAMCHSNVEKGLLVVGQARRDFDYGALRTTYHAKTKTFVEADLARRMKTWGPGRADVTEDDDEDPVAIPDLWGLRHQTFLTQAGTIKHIGPTALAIRQETQLLHSNHQKIRPPRELAYALALFLYSLTPPKHANEAPETKAESDGHALFTKHCRGCHSNDSFGGDPVAASKVGTDPALATGVARGTNTYRPPTLVRVDLAGPYFHHGAVATLDDVLSPERLDPKYTRGTVGKGAVQGHTYGTDLSENDRRSLVAYLKRL